VPVEIQQLPMDVLGEITKHLDARSLTTLRQTTKTLRTAAVREMNAPRRAEFVNYMKTISGFQKQVKALKEKSKKWTDRAKLLAGAAQSGVKEDDIPEHEKKTYKELRAKVGAVVTRLDGAVKFLKDVVVKALDTMVKEAPEKLAALPPEDTKAVQVRARNLQGECKLVQLNLASCLKLLRPLARG
jgi:hypothetical protein